MTHGQRTCKRAVLIAVLLLRCTGIPGPVEAGSDGAGKAVPDSGRGKSVLLSLKISRAIKRIDRVTLYRSVARQRKVLPTVPPRPPAGR
jgi:hypothetical protein